MILYLLGFAGFIACGEKESTDTVEEEMYTGVHSDDDSGNSDSDTREGLTCDDVPDCGGDLTGSWSYAEVCGESDLANVQQYQEYQLEQCPQIMNFDSDELVSGMFIFNEDGSAQNILTLNVDYSFTWPISDCPLESGTTACADVNPDDVRLPPADTSFDCVDGASEETCDCTGTHEYTWELDYTFQTTDSMITLESSAGEFSNFHYCVQEDTLLSIPIENGIGFLFTKVE